MQYLIVGNSAAGLNAAEAIRSRDPEGQVTIVSAEDYPAYSRCLIPYFMEGKVSEEDMLYRPRDYYEANRFNTMLGEVVVSVDPDKKTVTLESGKQLSYDKLLIATGGSPQIPDVPGMDKDGVFGFRTTQDLKEILRVSKTTSGAVVLGGGCVGLMAASGLHSLGLKVTVVIRSPHLLSQVADPEAGEIFRRRFEDNGVSVITGADVSEVQGKDRVENVKLDNGQELECGLIVAGKGVAANIDLLSGTDIETHWGVIVDEYLRSSRPDIYAAGDVAETTDVVTGEKTVNAIWPAAAEQGRIAGANMAGAQEKYIGSMRMNSAEFFGLPLISTGLVKPRTDEYEILTRYLEQKDFFRKVVLRDNIVVGAVLVGEIESAGVYALLMRKKLDVSSVKEHLLDTDFGYNTILPLVGEQKAKFTEPEYRESVLCASD